MQVNDFISDFQNLPSIAPTLQTRLNMQLSGGSAPVSLFIIIIDNMKICTAKLHNADIFWGLVQIR